MNKKSVAIVGSGPSALIAATILGEQFSVTMFEKNQSIGNKFLVAGKGGFNLTNSLVGEVLLEKYTPKDFMRKAILSFDSKALRKWLKELGVETFIGSSGRVFPIKGIKPAEVLNKIKNRLISSKVDIKYKSKFVGFDEKLNIKIEHKTAIHIVAFDFIIFALGGASWSVTGSDGKWRKYFNEIGVNTIPFQPSNCGVNIEWSENIIINHAGKPLKNISISVDGTINKGEAVITEYGLEGNVIYPLIPKIRSMLKDCGSATLLVDFKPDNSIEELIKKIENKSISSKNYAKIFNLKREQISIIKSCLSKDEFLSVNDFIRNIKKIKIEIKSLRSIDEAISTIGGIDVEELNEDFSIKKYPNIFCVGEMVDWDAPTGGYLLQGSFSMGHFAAETILHYSDKKIGKI